MAFVRIPSVLMKWINPAEKLNIAGDTVSVVLQNLFLDYPSLKPFIFPSDALSPFINIYVNRSPALLSNAVKENDEIDIVAALSGG